VKISELMGMLRDYAAHHGDHEVKVLNIDAGAEDYATLFILDLYPSHGAAVLRVGVHGD